MNDYRSIIERLNLLPHPEGGYYRRNWQSQLLSELRDSSGKVLHPQRSAGSSILYLLPSKEVSVWHRVNCDEMWHYYQGSTLLIHLLSVARGHEEMHLGVRLDLGELPQFTIPMGTWFCAEVADEDSFTFCGCTMWPSFSYSDFELVEQQKLVEEFPAHADLISRIFAKQNR